MKKIIYIILITTFITSCVKPSTHYPSMTLAEIEAEKRYQQQMVNEKNISKQETKMNKHIDHQTRLYKVAKRIMPAGAKLCNELGKGGGGCVFKFELNESKVVSAYADGKKIIVTQGMMDFAKKEDDLAVVLGHEYAHNIMGHIKALKQNIGIGSIFGSAIDIIASSQQINTNGVFGNLGSMAGKLGYSKEFEKEADYVGLYITEAAGYNIDTAPDLWRRMSLRDEKSIYRGVTHPTNPERYIALGKTIREIKRKKQSMRAMLPNIHVY